MEEYVYQVRKYLPLKFSDPESDEFLIYLEEAYLTNVEKEKYQFAFSAFHMLYMAFIYKANWFLKQQGNSEIQEFLNDYITHNRRTVFNSLFDLSQMPEKSTLENLLRSLSFHANEVGICRNHVDVRNNCLHSSGKIYYKKISQMSNYIEEELGYVKKIQGKLIPELKDVLTNFIDKNWNKKIVIGDWFIANYFSEKDLEVMVSIELPIFNEWSDTQEKIFKKIMNILLISEAQKNIDIDNKIITEKIISFANGLPQEIEIINEDKESRNILTREIIEEYLVPIISKFDEEDRVKTEAVFGL